MHLLRIKRLLSRGSGLPAGRDARQLVVAHVHGALELPGIRREKFSPSR